jgi:DNA polymerase-3 subunit alpha
VLSGQVDLFGSSGAPAPIQIDLSANAPTPDMAQNLSWERELLGLYLSHHPLEDFQTYLAENTTDMKLLDASMDGLSAEVGGTVEDVREIITKNGSKMAFVKLADLTTEIEVVVFPKVYDKFSHLLQRDKILISKGKLDFSRGDVKQIADKIIEITREQALSYTPVGKRTEPKAKSKAKVPQKKKDEKHKLYIRLEDSNDHSLLVSLKEKLDNHQGSNEVILVTGPQAAKQAIRLPQTFDINEQSVRELASIFGSTNVVVR